MIPAHTSPYFHSLLQTVHVHYKAVVLLLLVNVAPIVCGRSVVWSLFCYAVLSVLSSFAIILMRKREWLLNFVFLMSCDC